MKSDNIKRKFFSILICFALILPLFLASCENNESIAFINEIIASADKNLNISFETDFNVTYNKKFFNEYYGLYLTREDIYTVPEKINFNIKGSLKNDKGLNGALTVIIDKDENLTSKIYIIKNTVYIQLNDVANIILAVLVESQIIDQTLSNLFSENVSFDGGKYLTIPMNRIDTAYLVEQFETRSEYLDIESSTDKKTLKDFNIPVIEQENTIDFLQTITKVEKQSYKYENFRFLRLDLIFATEDNTDYLYVKGEQENGNIKFFDKVKINSSLNEARSESKALTAAYIPLRFITELMGKDIMWDADKKTAYTMITDEKGTEKRVDIAGKIYKGVTYVNIANLYVYSDFTINLNEIGEYIDITITSVDY